MDLNKNCGTIVPFKHCIHAELQNMQLYDFILIKMEMRIQLDSVQLIVFRTISSVLKIAFL